jgi:hypothetical protein
MHVVDYMYTQVNPAEMRIPAYWNLIGHSMTTLLSVLSPISILLPPLCD